MAAPRPNSSAATCWKKTTSCCWRTKTAKPRVYHPQSHPLHPSRPQRPRPLSGDTIIDHRFWGEQTLPLAWCCLAGRIKARQPDLPLYWLLIVKGDRTYRYLNVFSKTYYPNRRYPTPPETQSLIDHLAAARFGRHYLPESGLIRYPESQGHLKTNG